MVSKNILLPILEYGDVFLSAASSWIGNICKYYKIKVSGAPLTRALKLAQMSSICGGKPVKIKIQEGAALVEFHVRTGTKSSYVENQNKLYGDDALK